MQRFASALLVVIIASAGTSYASGLTTNPISGKGAKLAGKWKKVSEEGQEDAMLQFELITKAPMLISIKEKYDFEGTQHTHARRDQRSGKHSGKIMQANDHKVMLDIKWEDPHGGELIETFEIVQGGKLLHKSEIKVKDNAVTKRPGKWYTYQSVYTRE